MEQEGPISLIAKQSQPPAPPLLESLPTKESITQQDDEAVNRKSSMYAMADLPHTDLGDDSIDQAYARASSSYRQAIADMGEAKFRNQAEMGALAESVNSLASMANNAQQDPQAAMYAKAALAKTLQEQAAKREHDAAERKWAESVTAMRDNGNKIGAELSIIQHNTPDVLDNLIDIQTIRAQMMRKIEEQGVKNENRNLIFWLMDMAMYALPFGTSAAHTSTYQAQNENWFDWILSGNRFVDETQTAYYAMMNAGTSDERSAIIDNVFHNINQNVSALAGTNELLRLQLMSEYLLTPSADELNVNDLLQNAPIMGAATLKGLQAFKTPFNPINVFKGFGATTRAKNMVLEVANTIKAEGRAAAEAKWGKTVVDSIEDELLPDALNPKKVKVPKEERISVGPDADEIEVNGVKLPKNKTVETHFYGDISVDAAQALANGEQALEELIGQAQVITRLSDEDKARAVADLAERAAKIGIEDGGRKRTVLNAHMFTETHANGSEINTVFMTLGKAARKNDTSPWYKTETAAKTQMKKLGFGDSQIIKVGEDQYGIQIRMPVDETGKALGGARMMSPMADKMASGPFAGVARWLGGAQNSQSQDLKGAAHLSFDKRNRINKAIEQQIAPKFYALNKEEKDVLGAVLVQGERDKVWYTEGELEIFYRANFGSESNPAKFVDAYWGAKDINDIEYYLRNVAEHVNLSSQGYETVFWPELKNAVTGKVYRTYAGVPNEAIWNADEGIAMVGKGKGGRGRYAVENRLTEAKLKQKLDNGYVLVRTLEPQEMADGAKVRFFLMKGDKVNTNILEFQQIPYYPGGHRMYKANYFVKMGRSGKQPWGEDFFDTPFTPTASLTRAEGAEWAENANIVREAYNDFVKQGLKDVDLEDAVQGVIDGLDSRLGYPDAEEFVGWMQKNGSSNPFEVVYDRELPSMYSGSGFNDVGGWGEELSGINTFMMTQGKMFVSRKGNTLRNIRDWSNYSETYDPFTTLNMAMTQIAKLSSFTDFKIRSIQKWISTYGHALDKTNLEGANPMKVFLEGKFRTGTKNLQSVKAAAELQRAIIRRQLGWKSDFDLAVESGTRKVAEWVAGNKPGARSKLVHGFHDWWQETRPINAMQGMAYDATMGLFNIAQFPLQVQTSWIAGSIDLKRGGQAMANLPGVWMWLRKGAKEDTLDFLVSRGAHKMAGYDNPEDYKVMMRAMKRTGVMDNMLGALKNEYGPNAAMGMIGKSVDQIRKSGRFFTEKAEEINRINAWQMAWHMTRDKYPDMLVDSPLFVERVRSLTSTLSANMDEAAAAAWQRNVFTRIPTQFMAYMARWHELALPAAFGGSKELTAAQKMRFVAGQAFMYGRAGLPFAAYSLSQQDKESGKAPEIGTFEGNMSRGFADTLIWYATGADISFSSRAGIGMYPTDLIEEFFGGGRYGDTSAADIAGGAMGSIWGNIFDASFEALKYAAAETGGGDSDHMLTERSLKRLARSVASLNNFFKAEAILNYGQYTNRKGEPIIDDLPSIYAVAAFFGLEPGQLMDMTAQKGFSQNRRDRVDEWTKAVMINRVEFGRAMKDGDYNKARELQETAYTLGKLIPKDIKSDVFDKAYRDPATRTVAESIGERYEKEVAKGEFIKRNENN